jgi:DNA modification methylase
MEEIRWKNMDLASVYDRCGVPCGEFDFPCDLSNEHFPDKQPHKPYEFDLGYDTMEVPIDQNGGLHTTTKYPRDQNLRRALFTASEAPDGKGVMAHPAKAPIFQMEEIWRTVSMPGDIIMDIFGGTGTTMVAARENRKVVLLELEPQFHFLQTTSKQKFMGLDLCTDRDIMLLLGDNRKLLGMFSNPDMQVDHIMTSPPYGDILSFTATAESTKYLGGTTSASDLDSGSFGSYTNHPDSIGALPDFRFKMEMDKVYRLAAAALKPGGTLTSIMGDRTRGGQRVYLSTQLIKRLNIIGLEYVTTFKRYMAGTGFKKDHKAKGRYVVEDEDVIILRKPYES